MAAKPTNPMGKCPACFMLTPLCVCSLIHKTDLKTRLVLLMHKFEARKTSNSGRLACLSLENQEMIVVGRPNEPMDWASLAVPECENLFLFPADDAELLTPELVSSFTKPVRLIVADGNWGQAHRMRRRLCQAASVRKVMLVEGEPSEYRLRLAPGKKEGVSTLEAIARALAILESPAVEMQLMQVFRVMVERVLFTRGKIAREKVSGGPFQWP